MSAIIEAPRHMVESIASLRLPETADRRLSQLMDRNNDGTITPEEREELQALVDLSQTISLLRADALQVLGRAPQ